MTSPRHRLLIPEHSRPMATVHLSLRAGTLHDPPGREVRAASAPTSGTLQRPIIESYITNQTKVPTLSTLVGSRRRRRHPFIHRVTRARVARLPSRRRPR